MGCGGKHVHHKVVLPGGEPGYAFSSSSLAPVGGTGSALDIAEPGQGHHHRLILYKVLHIDFGFFERNTGSPFVAVLLLYFGQFVLDDLRHQFGLCKDVPVIGDLFLEVAVFVFQLFLLQGCQPSEAHIYYGLGLFFAEIEPGYQVFLGRCLIFRRFYDVDDFIKIIDSLPETFQYMGPCFCLFQVVPGSSADYFFLVPDIVLDGFLEIEDPGLKLTVGCLHQSQHIDIEGILHLCKGVQTVQNNHGIGVAPEFNHYTHAVPVGFITEVGYAFYLLIPYKLGDPFNQARLVDLVREFGYNNSLPVSGILLYFSNCPYNDPASPGSVGFLNAARTEYGTAGGEIRTLDNFVKFINGYIRVIYGFNDTINGFAKVMGWYVGGHPHCDSR